MPTFVLVHGAWQTASTWDRIVPLMRKAGHSIVVPKLRGLENDDTRLSPTISLSGHIEDVVDILNHENLDHVVLVGHSYAGMIITGVAEQVPHRLDRLVYVDAFVPDNGQSVLDLLPAPIVEMFRQAADGKGEGWRLRAGEAQLDMWGLKPGPERDFVHLRLSDFSLRCFEEAINLPTGAATRLPRTFFACVGEGYPARPVFERFSDRAKREEWNCYEFPTGHDCHVELPDAFAAKLQSLLLLN